MDDEKDDPPAVVFESWVHSWFNELHPNQDENLKSFELFSSLALAVLIFNEFKLNEATPIDELKKQWSAGRVTKLELVCEGTPIEIQIHPMMRSYVLAVRVASGEPFSLICSDYLRVLRSTPDVVHFFNRFQPCVVDLVWKQLDQLGDYAVVVKQALSILYDLGIEAKTQFDLAFLFAHGLMLREGYGVEDGSTLPKDWKMNQLYSVTYIVQTRSQKMFIQLKAVTMFNRLCFTAWNLTRQNEVYRLAVSPNAIMTKSTIDDAKAVRLAEAFTRNIIRRIKFPNGRLTRTNFVDFTKLLPKSTIVHIMEFLRWKDVIQFGMVNRFTRTISKSNIIWEKVCKQYLDPLQYTLMFSSPLKTSWIDEFLLFFTKKKQNQAIPVIYRRRPSL